MNRWKTREVMVGRVGVGGNNPIRIQSMLTIATTDVDSCVEEILALEGVGCEIVRLAVQGQKEVVAIEKIKNALLQRGCSMPLVADIHFYPKAALNVADFVEKVRVNPGNFAIEEFGSLVLKCKKLKKAIRIGVNHGSLHDSLEGMIRAAFAYAEICRKEDFHDFIFSMKASDPKMMILANRLLVAEMIKVGWNYPLHLGVTEAGFKEDGRIKSAIGIGALLLDGIGDTIRVSLTEKPIAEIDVCKKLLALPSKFSEKREKAALKKIKRIKSIELRPKEEKVNFVRRFFAQNIDAPVTLNFDYGEEELVLASAECGLLLLDGMGSDLVLRSESLRSGILQACHIKSFKTEFVSCPGCGRTLFDIQSVAESVSRRVGHLKGVKIAIMGCIVNGPGEMADADFGYIGSGSGKVDLFVGKTCVKRGLDDRDAIDHLIDLIKSHDKWVEVL